MFYGHKRQQWLQNPVAGLQPIIFTVDLKLLYINKTSNNKEFHKLIILF